MTSVLICATSLDGHINPMLTVARTLIAGGDRVRFLAGSRYFDAVAATGAEPVALPEEAQTNDALIEAGKFRDGRRLSGLEQAVTSVRLSFVTQIPAQYAALVAAIDAERPDVVVTESVYLGAAVLALRPRTERPPIVTCSVIPLTLFSRDTAPPGLGLAPRRGAVGRVRNAVLNSIVRRMIFGGVQREIDDHARALVGAPLNDFFLDTGRSADAFVQFTVPSFEYPRSDAPPNLTFVGPMPPQVPRTVSVPDWWSELDGTRPVIHVSQGTIANLDFGELVRPTIEALANEEVLVVASGGGRDLNELAALASNVRTASFLDYDQLMPKVDVFVTNGGYGSLHAALAHGVPIVVAGDTEDKRETSGRVAWAGVGVSLRTGTPTANTVRRAVMRILSDPSFRERAQRLGTEIAAAPGPAGIKPIIHRLISSSPVG